MNQSKKVEINRLFDESYEMINSKYSIEKPFLKIVYIMSSTHGSYNPFGFAYSDHKPVIKINYNRTLEQIHHTIIHEFCHLVNRVIFDHKKKPSHNIKFWQLCKEFGLPKSHYYKETRLMKIVYDKEPDEK